MAIKQQKIIFTSLGLLMIAGVTSLYLNASPNANDQKTTSAARKPPATGTSLSKVAVKTTTPPTQDRSRQKAQTASLIKTISPQDYAQRSRYGKLAHSLQGTAIPGLRMDRDGNLISDKSIRHLFEYFLSAASEEGQAITIARIQEYLSFILPQTARIQALEILAGYMAYKQELSAFEPSEAAQGNNDIYIAELRSAINFSENLRRKHMTAEVVEGLFAEQESFDRYSLQKVEVQLDSSLSYEEKDQRIASFETALPEHIRTRVKHKREAQNVERHIATLKSEGDNDNKIYALRKQFYGERVAQRWAFIEQDSEQWQAKITSFNQSKNSIMANSELSDDEKQQQISAIRNQEFNQDERLKLAFHQIGRY